MMSNVPRNADREDRKQEARDWLEAVRVATEAVYARHAHDNAVRDAVIAMGSGAPGFWGDRYRIKRRQLGGKASVWDVIDSMHVGAAVVDWFGLRREAQVRADQLNRDPTANYNGVSFPRIHNGSNVFSAVEPCDCMDPPKVLSTDKLNVCDRSVGTYCATHGRHDACPRDVRAIGLTCDPERLELMRINLEHKQREIEWQLIAIDDQLDELQQMKTEADRLGLVLLPVNVRRLRVRE